MNAIIHVKPSFCIKHWWASLKGVKGLIRTTGHSLPTSGLGSLYLFPSWINNSNLDYLGLITLSNWINFDMIEWVQEIQHFMKLIILDLSASCLLYLLLWSSHWMKLPRKEYQAAIQLNICQHLQVTLSHCWDQVIGCVIVNPAVAVSIWRGHAVTIWHYDSSN